MCVVVEVVNSTAWYSSSAMSSRAGEQQSAVLLPPAPGALLGHLGEQVDQSGVRAAVVEGEGADPFGADAEPPRFDVRDAGAVDAEQRGGLLYRHARLLAQFA